MNITEFCLRRHVTTGMIFLALGGFGVFSLLRLPLERLPDVDFPVIAVVTNYQGANPRDVETLLTEPIERAVASVEGVERIRSTSSQGTSVVRIEFGWGTDMPMAEIDVRRNLELFAEEQLPDESTRPLTFTFNPSLAPVVFMGVSGPMNSHELRRLATQQVEPFLARVPGVASAEVIGGLEREMQVELEPHWLQSLGLSGRAVVQSLSEAGRVIATGVLDDGKQALSIDPGNRLEEIEQLEQLTVGQRGGRLIPLSEVATVRDAFSEQTHVVTNDGLDSVMVAVRKQSDANTVTVARETRRALERLSETLPDGVVVTVIFDESEAILRSVENLRRTALQALLLTGLVLFAFLRAWRASLITLIAIPCSVLFAFTVMDALDITLNLISMAGLALAVGMLVDNSIVVVEAAFQHLERGRSPANAALAGAREMGLPLLASTLTTTAVFAPMLLVTGIASEVFSDLVLTICVTLLSSLAVALTLVPLMASRMLTGHARPGRSIAAPLQGRYEQWLAWALKRPRRVLGGAALCFLLSLGLIPLLGTDFLERSDVSELRLRATAEPGISLQRMRELMVQLEQRVRSAAPESTTVSADYGLSEGFGAIFGGKPHVADMRVKLKPVNQRSRNQRMIENAVLQQTRAVAGLDVELRTMQLGSSEGDVEVRVFSENLRQLSSGARALAAALDALPGAADIQLALPAASPQLMLQTDAPRLQSLGVTRAQIASDVAIHFRGVRATVMRRAGEEIAVRVRAPQAGRREVDSLRYLPIQTPRSGTLPLAAIAELREGRGATDIQRENQRRSAVIRIQAAGRDLGALVAAVEARIAASGLPPGLSYRIGGSAENMRDALWKLAVALLSALALVYMVMASQFESLKLPFIIMFTVPLAAIGALLALAVTGTTLQVTSLVGMILLGGVVVNNGIVLIDVIQKRTAEGGEPSAAVLTAARSRLRPILMTALTTILGMAPLAVGAGAGAETWAPMARAVMGGMVVSTALTLFVVPTLYTVMHRAKPLEATRKNDERGVLTEA